MLADLDRTVLHDFSRNPEHFKPYFEIPAKTRLLSLKPEETVTVIPVPNGIPFLSYYHNKKLVKSWVWRNEGLRTCVLPRHRPDIGSTFLKSKIPHHDFVMGVITVFKQDLEAGASTDSIRTLILKKLKNPEFAPSTTLRYVALAIETSYLPDVCNPIGNTFQLRMLHQCGFRSYAQLPVSCKDAIKKVKNVSYNHLSGGLQVSLCDLPSQDLDLQITNSVKTINKYGKWVPETFRLVTDKYPYGYTYNPKG